MAKENLNVRIPGPMMKDLKDIAEGTGKTITDVAIEALGKYLNRDVVTMPDRILQLENKMTNIEERLATLGKPLSG